MINLLKKVIICQNKSKGLQFLFAMLTSNCHNILLPIFSQFVAHFVLDMCCVANA